VLEVSKEGKENEGGGAVECVSEWARDGDVRYEYGAAAARADDVCVSGYLVVCQCCEHVEGLLDQGVCVELLNA
jgi:hypothetical protein